MFRDSYWPGGVPLSDNVVEQMALMPRTWEPDNPYYVKSHVNAPGTVRSWFRKMRAVEFERAVELKTASLLGVLFIVEPALIRWTLFDTQQVVDRETKATYPPPFKPDFTFYIIAEYLFLPRGCRLTDIVEP